MKSIFAISLANPNDSVHRLIRDHYPDSFEYNSTFHLVVDDCLAETVATKIGIKGRDRTSEASGFVIKLEEFSYSGYTMRSLWDWLKQAEKLT